jgi:hypothetical protein
MNHQHPRLPAIQCFCCVSAMCSDSHASKRRPSPPQSLPPRKNSSLNSLNLHLCAANQPVCIHQRELQHWQREPPPNSEPKLLIFIGTAPFSQSNRPHCCQTLPITHNSSTVEKALNSHDTHLSAVNQSVVKCQCNVHHWLPPQNGERTRLRTPTIAPLCVNQPLVVCQRNVRHRPHLNKLYP